MSLPTVPEGVFVGAELFVASKHRILKKLRPTDRRDGYTLTFTDGYSITINDFEVLLDLFKKRESANSNGKRAGDSAVLESF